MFKNNPLLSLLKQQIQKDTPHRKGVVRATDRSYGFLETHNGKQIFIPPNEMKNVLHGDRINAQILENENKHSATQIKLVKTETSFFIARLSIKSLPENKPKISILPTNTLIKGFFRIQGVNKLIAEGYKDGDWIRVKLLSHPLENDAKYKDKGFLIQVVKKIAIENDPLANRLVAVETYDLPNKAPNFEYPSEVLDPELPRKDLSNLPFFTIDCSNTQAMDDALYIEETENGWIITVAIADPDAFIEADSPIDQEAKKRGFTHYLPNFNVPILPRDFIDNLCSLKQGKKRAALCCRMKIDLDGQLVNEPDLFAAWITSQHRLNYEDVEQFLSDEEPTSAWQPSPILGALLQMLATATLKRLQWRTANNIVFKFQPEYTLKLNNKGEIDEIICDSRSSARRLVEESMIAANISVANFLAKHANSGIFNTHEGFANNYINNAVTLLAEYGIKTDPSKLTTLDGYTKAHQQSTALHHSYLQHRLRKLLSYPDIKNTPCAHFVMGVQHYATWTSPMRKYGDLINHRLIKSLLLNQSPIDIDENLATHLNKVRRSQRLAERDLHNLLYSHYLQKEIKSQWRFKAEIFDIIKAGLRVKVQENGATFFMPKTLLLKKSQDAKFIECSQNLGSVTFNNQIELQLGDVIDVLLYDIKPETGQLIGKLADPFIHVE
ncbi:MAG: exoribonuclease II [Psychromonas sp.]|nr:exoribonuclease II [Psychromonas sp.]